MPIDRDTLVERAKARSEEPDDYWDRFCQMMGHIPDLDRARFSQKQWNWMQQVRAELTEAWE